MQRVALLGGSLATRRSGAPDRRSLLAAAHGNSPPTPSRANRTSSSIVGGRSRRRCSRCSRRSSSGGGGSNGGGGTPASASPQAPAAAQAPPAAAAAADQGEPYSLAEEAQLAGGTQHLVRLGGGRMLRVWMPPGYTRAEAARRCYPLLLLNDGQNLFEDSLSFSGTSWRAAHTAAQLVAAGALPPFLVAGIDHAGVQRSYEYLPYKPGSGPGGMRSDAAGWPGGGAAAYTDRVFNEMLPFLCERYGASAQPERIAFGGSSFGGICTLYACMRHAGRFGAALVESPSLWLADELFLREDLRQYTGPWPQRVFVGMGSREWSGTRQLSGGAAKQGAEWDALAVGYCSQLAELLEDQGLGHDRLKWQVVSEAGPASAHTEAAWAARLPGALAWLLEPWWAGEAEAQQPRHS